MFGTSKRLVFYVKGCGVDERNGDDGGNVESVQFQQQDPAGRTKLNHSACRVLRSFGPRSFGTILQTNCSKLWDKIRFTCSRLLF